MVRLHLVWVIINIDWDACNIATNVFKVSLPLQFIKICFKLKSYCILTMSCLSCQIISLFIRIGENEGRGGSSIIPNASQSWT